MTLLCSGHHVALHHGLLAMQGQAPYDIAFRWTYGAPVPPGLAPDAREALIAQRIQEILAGHDTDACSPVPASDLAPRPTRDADTTEGAHRRITAARSPDRDLAHGRPG